jgi:hypothetical protein
MNDPWTVGPYDPESGAYHLHPYLIYRENEQIVAYVPDEPDARLIAAAPEMAELLNEFATMRGYEEERLMEGDLGDRTRALLSRIRGEA